MFAKGLLFRITAPLALAGAALAVASCSGAGSSNPAPPATANAGTVSTSATASASTSPTAIASASATLTAMLGTTLSLASVAGFTGTLSFSSAPNPSGVSVTSTGYNYAPPAALPTVPPAAFPTNAPGSQPSPTGGATPTVIVGWIFQPTVAVTISSFTQTYTGLSASASGKAYYTYFGDMTSGASYGYNGQGVYNATTLTFSVSSSANPTQLSANHWYVLEVVSF